jgi:hypothetical protein
MNSSKLGGCVAWIASFSLCFLIHGQGFVNLNFESANLPVIPAGQYGGNVSASAALPGWRVFYGTNSAPETAVLHNNATLGTRSLSVFGPYFTDYPIIEGQFMPFLQTGFGGSPGASGIVTIEQTGLVPVSAQSLQFKVGINNQIGVGLDTNFLVSLNGQTLSLVPLETTATYATYGVDVTSFAGQVSDLRFTSYGTVIRPLNWVAVDSFQFLSTAVPEPSTWALLVLGSALFWCAARRGRSRK